MALNLSTLTNPATSASILNEALTTADLLDPVPILKNLSRGSNKGGDAKQTTGLNQPRALPLIKNPSGNLGGYLYIPNVAGNYATGPSVTIGSNQTWEGELDMVITQWGGTSPNAYILPMGGGDWDTGFGLIFYPDKRVRPFSKGSVLPNISASGVTLGTPFNAKFGFDGTYLYVDIDDSRVYELYAPDQSVSRTHELRLNSTPNLTHQGNYAIQKAKLTVNSAVVFDCDFNGSTSIRHGDTKFQASVGGPVTINQSGNDPATIIKKSVLRFDGANDGLQGLFANNINGGYMFAAFSVLGTGGESNGRVFTVNATGDVDYTNGGAVFNSRQTSTNNSIVYVGTTIYTHGGLFDDANGDVLYESKLISGTQYSKYNNADVKSSTANLNIQSDEFNIGQNEDGIRSGGQNASFDLEFLALFSADSVPDEATASKIRDYINKRNNVFSLVDNSYYFFDPQKATFTGNFTGANTLDGYITGSDLGDTDVRSNLTLEQSTLNDQPSTDGYTITFNDAAEHLEFENAASQTLAGWQVCGTSLGTFVYRVRDIAVTELNLLGNLGNAGYRQAGQSYGIILLPESATGADIEQARKLLIDRGAADGTTASSLDLYFLDRSDIVEIKSINFTSATSLEQTFQGVNYMVSFPQLDLNNTTTVFSSWRNCSSLSSFGTTEISNCTDFSSAWQNCSSLQSFPAGAKLGTSASGVDFTSAWRASGLTSFPDLDLSNGNLFSSAWRSCSALTSFQAGAKLGDEETNVDFTNAWQQSGLTSFSTTLPTAGDTRFAWKECTSLTSFSSELPQATNVSQSWYGCSSLSDFSTTDIKNCTDFTSAWKSCSALTSFPAGAKLGTSANSVNFQDAWRSTGLTSFSTPLPTATNLRSAFEDAVSLVSFNSQLPLATNALFAWDNCSSLTSFDVSLPSLTAMYRAWAGCSSLTDFSVNVFSNWNPQSISSGVFDFTWQGCTSLTAQSVENILTSIDASGKYATSTGASGGSALTDAGIDIDYNVATGSLSAATNTAIDSLKTKGWSIFINSVEQ